MEDSHRDGKVAEVSEELEKSLSIDTDDKMERYHRLIQDGKDVARAGNMVEALQLFRRAHDIQPSQKLGGRIRKIEELLAQNEDEDEDEEFVDVNGCGLMLFKELHDKLYAYQREGVAFLYSLYRDGRGGGILADDMGLGKTIQVISFLSGMYDGELVKHVLLVMPMSLITNWTKEFAKWTPGMRVKEFHGASKAERTRNLEEVQRRGGVVVTTYSMLMNNWQQLASFRGREFTWDHVILDEAHKIKSSSTKTAKSACAVPSKNRVLLTGTPVQNNLREMWALFDFACQGTLLGTAKTFKAEYENPITRAREKDATPGEKALGSRMSETLMAIIQPYFLRRTKADVQRLEMNDAHPHREEESDKKGERSPNRPTDGGAAMPKLMRKNDLIVWTYLSAVQEDIYRQFISLDHIKELLMTSRSPLAELNILKKLCDHPRLLSAGAVAKLGLEESGAEANAHGIADVPDDTLISESGKLVFLFALLERLRRDGHRTLVFAHYRKVLDIVERILGRRGFDVLRLDGTVTQIAERERRISLFQTDRRYSVFLLTTQVGGVGITLTAANRVVIYDPSWNPATDAQAVDRVYRIGQTENVVIYRLITCGTVEEKIYRRQVFKDSLIRQSTGDKKNPFRYFSEQELKELFTLEDPRTSSTQLQLQALHSRHRRTDPELDRHIAGLHAMNVFGISDHDLMFSLDVHHDEAPEDQEEHRYIEGRVQKAQELTKAECELQMKRAAVIYDSEEEDDDDDDEDHGMKSQLDNSFQVLGASTPKSAPSSSAPLQSRRSVGGNVSVSSRRSLLLSIIEDMDVQRVPPDVEGKESEIHSDEAEEEDVVGPSHDGLQLEETLKTEEDEEEEEQEQQQQPEEEEQQEEEEEEEEQQQQQEEEEEESADIEEMSLSLEESSSEAELGSSERMDQFTAVTGTKEAESESYESLVLRGREFYNAAQLDDALTFFLRAIDMKPGDPEVQLMTIQLYRQLSKRS
ncbi:DNA excision repair protein ERCC-6-like [Embiotoca jacksoni]|uniref:DNA excision repair protein ERCC-6-like n=1 Tax=Embiotoca jacksoni TaxID=100190 RepID=UPI003703BFDF